MISAYVGYWIGSYLSCGFSNASESVIVHNLSLDLIVCPLWERHSFVLGRVAVLLLITYVGFAIADELGVDLHGLDGTTACTFVILEGKNVSGCCA